MPYKKYNFQITIFNVTFHMTINKSNYLIILIKNHKLVFNNNYNRWQCNTKLNYDIEKNTNPLSTNLALRILAFRARDIFFFTDFRR